jgi:hypothetical protein
MEDLESRLHRDIAHLYRQLSLAKDELDTLLSYDDDDDVVTPQEEIDKAVHAINMLELEIDKAFRDLHAGPRGWQARYNI